MNSAQRYATETGASVKKLITGLVATAAGVLVLAVSGIGGLSIHISTSESEEARERNEINQLVQEAREIESSLLAHYDLGLQEALWDGSQSSPLEFRLRSIIAALNNRLGGSHKAGSFSIGVPDLGAFRSLIEDWHQAQVELADEHRNRVSLGIAHAAIGDLRSEIEMQAGRLKIKNTNLLRDFRGKSRLGGSAVVAELLDPRNLKLQSALRASREEIAELRVLVETVEGIASRDRLVSVKENELKPSLERLESNLRAVEELIPEDQNLLPKLLVAENRIFGKGFVIDQDQQSIRLGEGGLFNARERELVHLARKDELTGMLNEIQRSFNSLDLKIQERLASFLESDARGLETHFQQLGIGSLLVLLAGASVFTVIARRTFRMVDQQVRAIEESRAKALEASKLKSEFVANMSHELRTPLNGVIGMTELALTTKLTPEQEDYLKTVRYSGKLLLTIIGDVLDFSKIEAGKLHLHPEPFDLAALIEGTSRVIEPLISQKGIEIAWVLDFPRGQYVGDSNRLVQVLMNLVSNAIKFTPEGGGIIISVKAEPPVNGSITLQFSVNDSGIGIPEEKHQEIFESFTQADGSTTRKYGGTGLGLTISRSLVEMMHGKIWLDSSPGVGSAFHFIITLPFSEAPAEQAATRAEPPSCQVDGAAPAGKILVVEDNDVNRKLIARILRKNGFEFELAENGKEAIDLLEQRPFRLVLMDLQMPVMNGLDATRVIRASDRPYRSIPIVALTAHTVAEDRDQSIAAGMSGYLTKPISVKELLSTLHQFVGMPIGPDESAGIEAQ